MQHFPCLSRHDRDGAFHVRLDERSHCIAEVAEPNECFHRFDNESDAVAFERIRGCDERFEHYLRGLGMSRRDLRESRGPLV